MNEDLKWLAENVHEWNFDDESGLVKSKHDGEYFFLRFNSDKGYTRAQWQAARDELSGKPSWDDVEGEWIAQDCDGEWNSFVNKPYHGFEFWNDNPCYRGSYGKGIVLGDWRNTLERRPKPECNRCEDDIAECDCSDRPAKQWRGPEDRLPPVGSCCEMEFTSGEWHEVKIEHYSRKHVIFTDQDGEERVEYMYSFKFRPTRTEEDEAVDEMMESGAIGAFYGAGGGAINDAAFEALFRQMFHNGYRKRD